MTENKKLDLMKKFKELNVAKYTTKYGDYYGLMFAGAEIATKELLKENAELKKKCYKKAVKDYCKLEKENAELKGLKEVATELIENIIRVTWGEGWSYSLDWKVKAEQFIKG